CDPSVVIDTSLSCGFLNVPLDYHNPPVGTARLAIIKINATEERRGSLFFNPGGPGNSGLAQLGAPTYKELLLQVSGGVYDIISWDPRGVGTLTTPGEISYFDSAEEYLTFLNGTIELTGIEEEVGRKCLKSPNGKYLKYVGTAAAVRDMVSIADMLDGPDAPINFIGASYGSLIGSWFVNMFPERVGKVILNGIVNPVTFATQKPSVHFTDALVSADAVYKGLITGCALAGPAGCAAAAEGDGPLDVDAKFQALIKAAHDATARASNASSVPLSSGQIRVQLYNAMYTPAGWDGFMKANCTQYVEVVKGETGASATASSLAKRVRHDTRAAASNRSPPYSPQAIFCGDAIDVRGFTTEEQFQGLIDTARNVSHMFGGQWPFPLYQCAFWPVRAVERYQGPFDRKLANRIIVASNVYDPATPLASAEEVARQLGEDAVLVRGTRFPCFSSGHTTIAETSTCTNVIFNAYLVNGTLPPNDTLCEVDAGFELFGGVSTADIYILAHLPSADV
ncbi:alpha/beta-hydrolase, partial [Lentinus tigrinus ALCF2SS1-6]